MKHPPGLRRAGGVDLLVGRRVNWRLEPSPTCGLRGNRGCGRCRPGEAARQVGEVGRAVAAVAREFGVGWQTVMHAVDDGAACLFAAQGIYTIQTRPCGAGGRRELMIGLTGAGAAATSPCSSTWCVADRSTSCQDARNRRYGAGWRSRPRAWRAGVRIVTLDPAAPYAPRWSTPNVGLPNAQLALDRLHAEKLAGAAIDDVRRRVQNETLGHRAWRRSGGGSAHDVPRRRVA